MNSETVVRDTDVFMVSKEGSAELTGGWTKLPALELALLVVLDGKTSLADAGQRVSGSTAESVRAAAAALLRAGFIAQSTIEQELSIDFSYFFNDRPAPDAVVAAPGAEVTAEAARGEAALKIDGYYVSIARKAAASVLPNNKTVYSVLIVEDNADLQLNLKMLLRMEGFLVRQARNREEILAELRKLPLPDVTLLDVNLPDANGFDVLARVRQHPQLKAMRIIMLTALASRTDVLRGLSGGADGYITKPYERETLLAGVKAVLGLHASASVVITKPWGT